METTTKNIISVLERKSFEHVLQGERVQLVRSAPQYTQQVWECIQRDHNLSGEYYRWVETIEDVAKHLTSEITPEDRDIDYFILNSGVVVGSVHIHTISYSDHKAEVGYALEKGEEGKGFASESLQLLLQEMKRLGFNKAVISCDKNNQRSIKVAERNGFRHEGTLIEDCIEYGKFRDSMIFGILLRNLF